MHKRASDYFTRMNHDTQLLNMTKEEFIQTMNQVTAIKRKREEKAKKKRDRANSGISEGASS